MLDVFHEGFEKVGQRLDDVFLTRTNITKSGTRCGQMDDDLIPRSQPRWTIRDVGNRCGDFDANTLKITA